MKFCGIGIALILCRGNWENETTEGAQIEMMHWPNSSSEYIFIIIIINTLFEIGKKWHSSAKNLQSNLYQLEIIIVIK